MSLQAKQIFGFGCAVFIAAVVLSDNDKGETKTPSPPAVATPAAAKAPPANEPLTNVPAGPKQGEFIDIIAKYGAAYENAANDMAKGAQRQGRASDICSLLKNMEAKDWGGFITELSSNGDGLGVLAVETGSGITIKTWNNAISDAGDNTLLKASSPVFKAAINLHVGQAVKFSGTFIKDKADCIRESSMTQSGSMSRPEFIMRFTSLEPIGPVRNEAAKKKRKSLLRQLTE